MKVGVPRCVMSSLSLLHHYSLYAQFYSDCSLLTDSHIENKERKKENIEVFPIWTFQKTTVWNHNVRVMWHVIRPFNPSSVPQAASTNKGAAAITFIKQGTTYIIQRGS